MFPWCLQELEAQRSISPCSPSRGSWRFGGDGDADNTVKAYQNAVRSLADWLAEDHPEMGPVELDRQHIRGWLVEVRERHSSNTARGWFAGVRHGRRRRPAGPDRVRGWQGQPAEWPRHRVVSLGVKAARALDRYLPERRRHPYVDTLRLWLGSRGRPTIDADGVKAMLKRRAADAGIADLHPHAFRHTWAHAFRAAGGNEGDLMLLGGWRSRAMLDRYGKAAAADRAADAYRRLSLGDRI
jgi:hypothetical protein